MPSAAGRSRSKLFAPALRLERLSGIRTEFERLKLARSVAAGSSHSRRRSKWFSHNSISQRSDETAPSRVSGTQSCASRIQRCAIMRTWRALEWTNSADGCREASAEAGWPVD